MTLLDQSPRMRVPEHSAETFREQLLIEEARRLRRRRWCSIAVVVTVIATGAVASTIGSGTTRPPVPTLRAKGSTFHLAPLSKSATTSGLLDYLMPTDSADFASGMRFGDRMDLAAVATQLTCMTRLGEAGFGRVLRVTSEGDNTEFPDLAVLSRQSHSSGSLYSFHGPFPVVGKKNLAFALARQHCGTSAYGAENRLLGTGGILTTWADTTLPAIDRSAGFKVHDAAYDSCIASAGLSVSSLWSDSDALETKLGPAAYARSLHLRSSTYARCIRPVDVWRDHVRSLQRGRVINSHRAQLAQVYAYLRA